MLYIAASLKIQESLISRTQTESPFRVCCVLMDASQLFLSPVKVPFSLCVWNLRNVLDSAQVELYDVISHHSKSFEFVPHAKIHF